jgi:AcrR family transcriptional regulator
VTDFPTKGDHTRAEILSAARRLFLSQGFNGTSMRAIAREAGDRAVAGLYNHFPTKQAIFRALIEEQNPYGELFAIFDEELGRAQTAPAFLRAVLSTVLQVMPRHYDFIQLVQIDMREFEGRNVRGLLMDQLFPRIFAVLNRVQTLPGLKPTDPLVLLRLMASVVLGFIVTDQLAPRTIFGAYTREEWGRLLADALLDGLAAPDGVSASGRTESP